VVHSNGFNLKKKNNNVSYSMEAPNKGLLHDGHVKAEFMDGPHEGYIYNILDTKKGKNYVGSKVGAINDTEDYLGSGTIIKKIAKKRPDTLHKTILGKTKTRRELIAQEEAWLTAMNAAEDKGMYNLTNNYFGGAQGPEAIEKIRAGLLGTEPWNKGKKTGVGGNKTVRTQAVKDKISKTLTGRKLTPEHIQNTLDGRAGYTHSDATKEKIGISNTGKKRTPEQIQKSKDGRAGYKPTQETKDKTGASIRKRTKSNNKLGIKGIRLTPSNKYNANIGFEGKGYQKNFNTLDEAKQWRIDMQSKYDKGLL